MMTLLQRVDAAKRFWCLLMPSSLVPDESQFARWLAKFTDTEMEFAIGRTAAKVRRGLLPNTDTHKFTTGVLLNERKSAEVARQNPGQRSYGR